MSTKLFSWYRKGSCLSLVFKRYDYWLVNWLRKSANDPRREDLSGTSTDTRCRGLLPSVLESTVSDHLSARVSLICFRSSRPEEDELVSVSVELIGAPQVGANFGGHDKKLPGVRRCCRSFCRTPRSIRGWRLHPRTSSRYVRHPAFACLIPYKVSRPRD